ncbi:hypothetical protein BZZ01_00390 [Nostocales cyanobacterium HT-58-2]|nr:hypothetical protein BZZ01_00390 [Nostocales cyanobacterium HT-58-2]
MKKKLMITCYQLILGRITNIRTISNLISVNPIQKDFKYILVKEKQTNSLSEYCNKWLAELQYRLREKQKSLKGINRLSSKRYRKFDQYLQGASAVITQNSVNHSSFNFAIRKNPHWEEESNNGKTGNLTIILSGFLIPNSSTD